MNAQTLQAVVGGMVPVVREYVAQQLAPLAAANEDLREQVRSLQAELATRAALPAGEPPKQLAAGDPAPADDTAERMARLAALIDFNARTLRMAA